MVCEQGVRVRLRARSRRSATPLRRYRRILLAALLLLFGLEASAQVSPSVERDPVAPSQLVGTWAGHLDMRGLVALDLVIERGAAQSWSAQVRGRETREGPIPVAFDAGRIQFQPSEFPVAFEGALRDGTIEGFVHHGQALFHVRLDGDAGQPTWRGRWSLSAVSEERTPVDLYIAEEDGGHHGAYLFFRDPRMPSLWTHGFECDGGTVRFLEKNLELEFTGRFDRERGTLEMDATGLGGTTPVSFERLTTDVMQHSARFLPGGDLEHAARARSVPMPRDRAPEKRDDGWPTATPSSRGFNVAHLDSLVAAIARHELTLTHAVLIAQGGTLVFEEYFYGFDADVRHDMRSASKTVAAALTGIAIEHGVLPEVETPILRYFPRYRRLAHWDVRKARIRVHDLLNMASGLDANDSDPASIASENAYQSQPQPDWMRFALDAPMRSDPGTQSIYGSANPLLVGGVLQAVVDGPLERFAHEHLFGPLGVHDYKWFLVPSGDLYLGGGMHMRPRDMLKFGQLHLNGGTWRGARILSGDWVRRSMAKYGRLDNARDKNAYGYLWWHHDYQVDERRLASIEARGAGGQYLFVVPELDVVAVVTSGNYRNGRFRQPEDIMERYILPAVVATASHR